MCGRFSLKTPVEELARKFGARKAPQASSRYNIAPSQEVLAVRNLEGERELTPLLWGLIPSWSREPQGFINARAETVTEKPSFRDSFKRRPCLIPADGYYEWRKQGREGVKQPYYFRLQGGRVFAFAGVWDEWRSEGVAVPSCAIITTAPNEVARAVHDRMPVILREEDYDLWLDPDPEKQDLRLGLLRPYNAAEMDCYPVSIIVNSPQRQGAELIEPLHTGAA
jgi:putative SOS response-associated peptidase YedK